MVGWLLVNYRIFYRIVRLFCKALRRMAYCRSLPSIFCRHSRSSPWANPNDHRRVDVIVGESKFNLARRGIWRPCNNQATTSPNCALIFVARKDWAGLFGMLGGATVSLIFSVAVWGLQPWNDWLNFLPQFREFLHVKLVIGSTITLAGQADAAGLNPIPFLLLQVLGASFLALRIPPDAHGSALVAWIVGTSTMASPYSLTHDTVALMPAVITSIVMLNWRSLPATLLYLGWAVHLTLPAYLVAQLLQQDDAEIESSLPSK